MIISFDLRGLFQATSNIGIGGGGFISDFGYAPGVGPTPPPAGSVVEYIYFARHRLRR